MNTTYNENIKPSALMQLEERRELADSADLSHQPMFGKAPTNLTWNDEYCIVECEVGAEVTDGSEQPVAIILDQGDDRRPDVRSTAALFAAAPDLLAACKEFVRKCDCGEARSVRSYAEMRAAVEKAEGGAS